MRFISWILYIPLQIIAFPFCILGMLLVAYRQMRVSKRLGVSQTAIEVFNARWTLNVFGMRNDPGAAKLGSVLPNTSTVGLWLTLFPLWFKAKVAAKPEIYPRRVQPGREIIMDLFTTRTLYFDSILARRLPTVEQFVLLGAGMDTRPYGALNVDHVNVFELDLAATQNLKRESLQQAAINSDHVNFIETDFTANEIFRQLDSAGYDAEKKTLFLWEGVTLYLSETAVRSILAKVRAEAVPGSVLLADIYSDRLVAQMNSRLIRKTLRYTHETVQFALKFDKAWEHQLRIFVESTGFTLGETFFMGTQSPHGPFVVVVELAV
ncbi:MAG: class I SAM-dependent methyltransferase [Planctomycetota bacterium]|nr:class I SAM-dependent methyltransferase [Planctomycetota bacterium]